MTLVGGNGSPRLSSSDGTSLRDVLHNDNEKPLPPACTNWQCTPKSKKVHAAVAAGGSEDQMGQQIAQSEEVASSVLRGDAGTVKAWFDQQLRENEITGFIFYRGFWWIMWPDYLAAFNRILSSTDTKNRFYAVSSERQDAANAAIQSWNLNNYAAVLGDHENKLVRYIKDTYLPKLHITDCSRMLELDPELTVKNYPHGAVQPGVLIFVGDRPALGWACVPTAANLQGALGRPDPDACWNVVEQCVRMRRDGKPFGVDDGEGLPKTATYGQACRNCCHCIIM